MHDGRSASQRVVGNVSRCSVQAPQERDRIGRVRVAELELVPQAEAARELRHGGCRGRLPQLRGNTQAQIRAVPCGLG